MTFAFQTKPKTVQIATQRPSYCTCLNSVVSISFDEIEATGGIKKQVAAIKQEKPLQKRFIG